MSSIFLSIYNFFQKRKILFWIGLVTICAWVVFYAIRIRFEEDITRFIPKGKEVEEVNEVFKNQNLKDRLIIEISQTDTLQEADPAKLTTVADTFVRRLSDGYKNYIGKIISNDAASGVYDYIINHLPIFLEKEDYTRLDSLLNGKAIDETMQRNYTNLLSPAGFALKNFIISDPLHIATNSLNRLKAFQVGENYEIISGYIFSKGVFCFFILFQIE